MTIEAFPMIEAAVRELVEILMPEAEGKTGGDPSYDGVADFYIQVALVPGGGETDETSGEWALDIDVYSRSYSQAMLRSLDLEAALIGRRRRAAGGMIIDNVRQNTIPSERPWDDDNVFRVGAIYVFTARRSG